MPVLIIPGFSLRNKDWADALQKELSLKVPAEVHYWQHWQTGTATPDWLSRELSLVASKIGNGSISILAKSIGTLLTARLARQSDLSARKIILCGLPLNDIDDQDQKDYFVFSDFSPGNLICFQNESDPHGTFTQVKEFFGTINPKIPVISKPRSDHEYPYATDFLNFLLI